MDYASSSRKTATNPGGGLGQCHQDMLEEQIAAIVGHFSVAEAQQRWLFGVRQRHRPPPAGNSVDQEQLRRRVGRHLFAEVFAGNTTAVGVKPRPDLLLFIQAVK